MRIPLLPAALLAPPVLALAAPRQAPDRAELVDRVASLIAVVEEQAQTLIRTAFSNTVREAGDLSAGVFDLSGRMLAQAVTGTPGARSRLVRGLVAGNSVVQLFWHSWRTPSPAPRTLLSFEVRDARLAHRLLAEAGVAARSEPVEFDNSIAFVIEDPDGHPLEIIQWTPDATPYRAAPAGGEHP